MSDSLWPHGLQHARLPCPSSTPGAYSNSCPSCRWCHPSKHFILCCPLQFSSVQFSCSVVSDSLRPHGLQHSRLPCPSPTPRACSNSCPLNQWCHPTISSSVIPFSSYLQSFPVSGSFPVSQFFVSGSPRFGTSASASVLPMNLQDWFPLGLIGLISLQSKGLSRVISNTAVKNHQSSVLRFLYGPALTCIHDYWKNHSFDQMDLFWQSTISAFYLFIYLLLLLFFLTRIISAF